MGRSTAQSRLRLAKDKTVPADELTDAHLMALGEFFSYKLCPLTILYYDFSCCAAMCSKRSLNVDTRTLIRWHFDPQSHTELRMRMFMAYVQEWKQISAAVLPSPSDPSSEEAYRCADRLRLSLVPNALELNETAMDSLNEKVKERIKRDIGGNAHKKPPVESWHVAELLSWNLGQVCGLDTADVVARQGHYLTRQSLVTVRQCLCLSGRCLWRWGPRCQAQLHHHAAARAIDRCIVL